MTFAAGDILTAASLNLLANVTVARLRRVATQSITNDSVATPWGFDTEDEDTLNGHDNSTNPSRYTCKLAGLYELSGGGGYVGGTTGRRGAVWGLNGTLINGSGAMIPATPSSNAIVVAKTVQVRMVLTDYVELFPYQSNGGALNSSGTTFEQPIMNVRYIRA